MRFSMNLLVFNHMYFCHLPTVAAFSFGSTVERKKKDKLESALKYKSLLKEMA